MKKNIAQLASNPIFHGPYKRLQNPKPRFWVYDGRSATTDNAERLRILIPNSRCVVPI